MTRHAKTQLARLSLAHRALLAFFVLPLGLAGCGESDSNAGSGGMAGSSGCPKTLPKHGAECEEPDGTTCSYDRKLANCTKPALTRCTQDPPAASWQTAFPAGCDALASGGSCDPVGKWLLDTSKLPDMGCAVPSSLQIGKDAQGAPTVLWADLQSASVSSDGCNVSAESFTKFGGIEPGTVQMNVSLTISGDQATGTIYCKALSVVQVEYTESITAQRATQ
jgi:hypothetical protein